MYQTIQVSSCVSVQGEIVKVLSNGDVVIRDGHKFYRGRPVGGRHAQHPLRDISSGIIDSIRNAVGSVGSSAAA